MMVWNLMGSGDKKFHQPRLKPERVKIDEDWEDAVDKALRKERPKEGWPTPDQADAIFGSNLRTPIF